VSEATYPIKTASFLSPLMLRDDLPRQTATDYRACRHGEIVKRTLPGVTEYVQHHFSATDHGFWTATETVGTQIPEAWRIDGYAVRARHSCDGPVGRNDGCLKASQRNIFDRCPILGTVVESS
jgi:hypothetical protein